MNTIPSSASTYAPNSTMHQAVPADCEPSTALRNSIGLLSRAWRWIQARQVSRSNAKRLQVTASVSLGEKRFVAVIQVDGLQYLIGGGASNVALLAKLETKDSFEEVLSERMAVPKKRLTKGAKMQSIDPAAQRKVQLSVKQGRKQA
jgi:flagellar biogenesis protein FliO